VSEPLPEPEAHWDWPPAARSVEHAEVERRIGRCREPLEVLPGGRSNLNVRIGGRVLRIYREDPSLAAKEAALLARPWQSFLVPEVLARGDDYVLMRFVEHGPVLATAEHGAAVGRALAEIHAVRFERAGYLDGELRVVAPLPGLEGLGAFGVRVAELQARLGPPVLVHGDFKPANLRWAAGRLLVLDWEKALAGPGLFDVGQLVRWWPPPAFVDAFAASYGGLPGDWHRWADALDLVNLVGKRARATPGTRRARDLERRIVATLAALG
jgi:phosphotransferase family enzyme